MIVPFLGQEYKHNSKAVSPQETINLIPELVDDANAKSKYILVGTPATDLFTDATSTTVGITRGLHYSSKSVLYAVFGELLVRITSLGGWLVMGNIGSPLSTDSVSMADNGEYLIVVDGQKMWSLKLDTEVFDEVDLTNCDIENPTQVVWLNNRMVAIGDNANTYFWSNNGDPLTWTGLDFNSANSSADTIISIEKRQNELWLFGKQSYEVHAITRDADLPFSYRGGSASEIGCGAVSSVAQINESLFWFGSNRAGSGQVFMSTSGYSAQRISTLAIENEISKIQNDDNMTTEDIKGFTYSQAGHTFYVMTFKSGNLTYVYDTTTNQWHRRTTRNATKNVLDKWEPTFAVFAYDQVICGSDSSARLFVLDLEKYEEYDGRPIVRKRVGPIYWSSLQEAIFDSFVLDLETGVGLSTGQGEDPLCMIRLSHDGGYTWGNQFTRSIGKLGEYGAVVRLNGLGSSRKLAIEVSISDPVKVVMLNADLEYEEVGL